MIPILHPHDAQTFTTFGIGPLSDAVSCVVDEERNGLYELTLKYPITGAFYHDIVNRAIIVAKPNYTDDPQPFRVYKVTRPINGIVTVYARHLTYDLSGYVDAPFTAVGIQEALVKMVSDAYCYPTGCPFSFYSDISSTKQMAVKAPSSVRSLMGGVAGSLIDLYGGEWSYDEWECRLNAHRGADRGFTVRYAKNLTELVADESVETLYTAVYPFYRSPTSDELVTLPERVLPVIETDEFTNVLTLDLSDRFEATPTAAALRQTAQAYIDNNDLGVPKINITINFVQGGFSERVDLCDTIHVYYDALGVSVSEKCIRTKWDVLDEKYIEIEVGYARKSIAKTIANVQESAEKAVETATHAAGGIAAAAAQKITGNLGGYVVMHDADGDGNPDEILIMDTADIGTAVNVIRMNDAGIAFSSDGYAGTYTSAWTIDGEFVADFITAGTLHANLVKILGDTNFWWDAGNINIQDPNDEDNQIRIGKYDGTHYGIGFTTDGGVTWQTSMNFSGLNAYLKNTTVDITADGVDISTAGHVHVGATGGGVRIDNNGVSVSAGSNIQIGVSGSGVTINRDGVKIDTGGHLIVDADNLEIQEDGTLSAEKAYLSGAVYSGGNPVLTRGGDVVVSSSQPASGKPGMIWIKPDPATSVGSEYSFQIPSSWGSRLALYNNHRQGNLTGQGIPTSYTNCNYTIDVPIYLREHSGTPAGGTLRCVVSDGTHSIVFTATVNEATTGTGNRVVTMSATSNFWIGAESSLTFTLSCDQVSGYYVYNVLNSSDTASSIHLSCTASGAASGWVPGDAMVYV